jgi:hypothetical protein
LPEPKNIQLILNSCWKSKTSTPKKPSDMKHNRTSKYCGFAAAALLLAGAGQCFAQTADLTIATFDTATGTGTDNTAGAAIGWGPSTVTWDGAEGNPAGSVLITSIFEDQQDTPLRPRFCINGGNPWYDAGTVDFSQYANIQFDIKWDNTSDMTIDQFNDVSTIPVTQTNSDGLPILNSTLTAGATPGFDILICGPTPLGNQGAPLITNTVVPAAAANGWVHMTIPIDPTLAGLAAQSGITFNKWISNYGGQCANPAQARFWIDNITLGGTAGPPPPPVVKAPTKATRGLNVFASTAGLYDRQSAVLRQNYGLSWVGMATEANPVTYSFTIAGYPNSANCEAWLFLIPNPAALDGAPDWNETNAVKIRLQGSASSGTMQFQYKVNEPGQQAMYSGGNDGVNYWTNAPGSWDGVTPNYLESGFLGSVSGDSILGTWSIKFTSDTNVTLIAPNGNSTNLIMPSYNVSYFSEQASPGFYIYLGMQANNADAMNQAVVYSNFSVTGTAAPFSEDFLADSVLDTTNIWNTSAATGPKGVLIVPDGAVSWITWTLPDTGFSLETSPTLNDPLGWTTPTSGGAILGMNGIRAQLLSASDIPAGNTAFFQLIKRAATRLQVLLPGETNAPNTVTGKTGSPTAADVYAEVDATVYAVDDTFHIVNSSDTINLSSSDADAIFSNGASVPLVNGMATVPVYFATTGPQTVTADDGSNTNIISSTSAAITVQ